MFIDIESKKFKALWNGPIWELVLKLLQDRSEERWLRKLRRFLDEKPVWATPRVLDARPVATLPAWEEPMDVGALLKGVAEMYTRHSATTIMRVARPGGPLVALAYFDPKLAMWLSKLRYAPSEKIPLYAFVPVNGARIADTIAELGGPQEAVVTFRDVWMLLERQPAGEDGALGTLADTNLFFVNDDENVCHQVAADWYFGGWRLREFEMIGALYNRNPVFARNARAGHPKREDF